MICAHADNTLHLDLKPQNFFISDKGDLKLGDFGINIDSDMQKRYFPDAELRKPATP